MHHLDFRSKKKVPYIHSKCREKWFFRRVRKTVLVSAACCARTIWRCLQNCISKLPTRASLCITCISDSRLCSSYVLKQQWKTNSFGMSKWICRYAPLGVDVAPRMPCRTAFKIFLPALHDAPIGFQIQRTVLYIYIRNTVRIEPYWMVNVAVLVPAAASLRFQFQQTVLHLHSKCRRKWSLLDYRNIWTSIHNLRCTYHLKRLKNCSSKLSIRDSPWAFWFSDPQYFSL